MKTSPECKIAGTLLGLLLAASSLNAQTANETDAPAETIDPFGLGAESSAPPQEAMPDDPMQADPTQDGPEQEEAREPVQTRPVEAEPQPDLLAECRATADSLRNVIEQSFACPEPVENPELERLRTEIRECREDDRLNRTTNQRLNNDLQECLADNGPSQADIEALAEIERERDASRAELSVARAALEQANEEIAALQSRLESIGVGAEPGFRYAGTVDESYMRRDVANTSMRDDLKLSADLCDEALAWLDTQTGTDFYLRKLVWVWNEAEEILLCAPAASGGSGSNPASPSDEAHALIFE